MKLLIDDILTQTNFKSKETFGGGHQKQLPAADRCVKNENKLFQ
jgi:hypothetical protein